MCKHIAAVLYGVGARLDEKPELLFELRNVDHSELLTAAISKGTSKKRKTPSNKILNSDDLSGLFGIDLDEKSSKTKKRSSKRS
jgi:uncharacterized Zn finger protein